jgi:hypothetical protein
MSCCANEMTQKEHDEQHKGQCSECGCDVDAEGICCEMNDCHYSPLECKKCGYRPCDQSC